MMSVNPPASVTAQVNPSRAIAAAVGGILGAQFVHTYIRGTELTTYESWSGPGGI